MILDIEYIYNSKKLYDYWNEIQFELLILKNETK